MSQRGDLWVKLAGTPFRASLARRKCVARLYVWVVTFLFSLGLSPAPNVFCHSHYIDGRPDFLRSGVDLYRNQRANAIARTKSFPESQVVNYWTSDVNRLASADGIIRAVFIAVAGTAENVFSERKGRRYKVWHEQSRLNRVELEDNVTRSASLKPRHNHLKDRSFWMNRDLTIQQQWLNEILDHVLEGLPKSFLKGTCFLEDRRMALETLNRDLARLKGVATSNRDSYALNSLNLSDRNSPVRNNRAQANFFLASSTIRADNQLLRVAIDNDRGLASRCLSEAQEKRDGCKSKMEWPQYPPGVGHDIAPKYHSGITHRRRRTRPPLPKRSVRSQVRKSTE